MLQRRGSGVLLHVSSLPSEYGIGDFGPDAYAFVDFLAEAGQAYWQVLPLTPTDAGVGHSPYSSLSAFAGNTLFISPEILVQTGLLNKSSIEKPHFPSDKVDFATVAEFKQNLLSQAYDKFRKQHKRFAAAYEEFQAEHAYWLNDWASFIALKKEFNGKCWNEWPRDIRDHRHILEEVRKNSPEPFEREKFFQFVFFMQWKLLKKYANEKGIHIIGDAPIFVNYDSADVWAHPDIFFMDEDRNMTVVSGVPPDYFSETGQRWGNPLYNWHKLREQGFSWWVERIRQSLRTFDFLRIDHFRGFVGYWEIAAHEETAINGKWVDAPAEEFFYALYRHFPTLPLIAEDLGLITADVREIVSKFEFPGMRVMQFGFDGNPTNLHLPHNYPANSLAYTGTHDNNTVRGWFENETGEQQRRQMEAYFGRPVSQDSIAREFTRQVMASQAKIAIVQMQDVMNLDAAARMNKPAAPDQNWTWRLSPGWQRSKPAAALRAMAEAYGRV